MRDVALAIVREAIAALEPGRLARAAAPARADELWAVGKAARAMSGCCAAPSSLVVGPEDAGHPVPDARSLAAGRALLLRAAAQPDGAEVVLALSGGASALAVAPSWGLTLEEKIAATRAVSASGAPIAELNCVRKHLSALKGGRLAVAAARAHIALLVLSDVVGDDLSVIGSGPVTADPTRFGDALAIARRAGVTGRALAALEAGARGELDETPKRVSNVTTTILAGPGALARETAAAARARGLVAAVEPLVEDDVAALASRLVARAREQGPGRASVFAGEPVIQLPPSPGRGGRAQQTAALVAQALAEQAPARFAVLCAASDGRDGPTAAAGGVVDEPVLGHARAGRAALDAAVARCDAGPWLEAAGGLVVTGPTGTNLADVYVVVT